MRKSEWTEYLKIALVSIKSQLLRTILTVSMIAFGIMCLVGIITSFEAVRSKISTDFSRMGSNTFSVQLPNSGVFGGQQGVRAKSYEPISYNQASEFKEEYDFPSKVSISARGSGIATVKYGSEKTNPNVQVIGADELYLDLSGYEINDGRGFTSTDIQLGGNVVILGSAVADKIFPNDQNALNKLISIGNYKYEVIGVIKEKGNAMGMSSDNQCLIPISSLRKTFASDRTNYSINVYVDDPEALDDAISEAIGLLRIVRADKLGENNSFKISKSDSLANTLIDSMSLIKIIATMIGFLTLLGAGIGLMNIMLVSVTERTREIGVRKAIGASAQVIKTQFLIESVLIGQIGGIMGILLGLVIGNVVAVLIGAGFTAPWGWMIFGVTLCFVVGVASGFYPAKKASELDPIEALRHE